MAPTVFRDRGYRYFFFSREEARIHVHVAATSGEAKFWLEPEIRLARNFGLSARQLREVEQVIKDREDEFRTAWFEHFGR